MRKGECLLSSEVVPKNKYIQFRLGQKLFVLNICGIEEVIKPQEIVEVPSVPSNILGVTRYRNMVIPVVDIKKKLGVVGSNKNISSSSKIIVVIYNNENIGILIDELIGVLNMTVEEVQNWAKIGCLLKLDEILS